MIKKIFKKLDTEAGLLQRFAFRNDSMCKKIAFTLAEVLITLGIIGVVAALTLPTLIQKQQEKATVVKVQKAYSILSQAYKYAVEEYGVPSLWDIVRDEANTDDNVDFYKAEKAAIARDNLLFKVKMIEKCDNSKDLTKCGFSKKYYQGNYEVAVGSPGATYNGALLNDGLSIRLLPNEKDNNGNFIQRGDTPALKTAAAWIEIDTNGQKQPNALGKDIFRFYLTDYGIIPVGTKDETGYTYSHSFITTCYTNGSGCTAWVLQQKNLKYLHSDKCSWENTSCK